MRFTELNLFGVYVAPVSLMMLMAWIILLLLRRVVDRYSLFRYVWHPALFTFAVYLILLSSIVLLVGATGS